MSASFLETETPEGKVLLNLDQVMYVQITDEGLKFFISGGTCLTMVDQAAADAWEQHKQFATFPDGSRIPDHLSLDQLRRR